MGIVLQLFVAGQIVVCRVEAARKHSPQLQKICQQDVYWLESSSSPWQHRGALE